MKNLTEKDYELITQLLGLLNKYGRGYFQSGLCQFVGLLCRVENITHELHIDLLEVIKNISHPTYEDTYYWFEPGDIGIRIDYLKGLLDAKTN